MFISFYTLCLEVGEQTVLPSICIKFIFASSLQGTFLCWFFYFSAHHCVVQFGQKHAFSILFSLKMGSSVNLSLSFFSMSQIVLLFTCWPVWTWSPFVVKKIVPWSKKSTTSILFSFEVILECFSLCSGTYFECTAVKTFFREHITNFGNISYWLFIVFSIIKILDYPESTFSFLLWNEEHFFFLYEEKFLTYSTFAVHCLKQKISQFLSSLFFTVI